MKVRYIPLIKMNFLYSKGYFINTSFIERERYHRGKSKNSRLSWFGE